MLPLENHKLNLAYWLGVLPATATALAQSPIAILVSNKTYRFVT